MDWKLKIGGVIFILIGLGLVAMGFADYNRHQKFKYESLEAQGTIVQYIREAQRDTETKRTYYIDVPVIRFTIANGETREDRSLSRDPKQFPIGATVPLKYLRDNPSIVEYPDSSSYTYTPYLMGGVGLACIASGCLFLFLKLAEGE